MATSLRSNLTIEMIMASASEDYTITRPLDIVDCHITSIAGGTGESVTAQRQALGVGAFNAITSAMACVDALGTVARTTLLAVAQDNLAATDVLRGAGSATTTRARLIFSVLPDPIT